MVAKEAIDLLVILNNALHAPPFKGKVPTTSPYIFLKKKGTRETISNVMQAYCPAKAMAKADTYNTDEFMSFPQIA